MKATPSLTAERLREALHYDPETGVFTWKVPLPRSSVGERAEFLDKKLNHYRICVDKARISAHRLAWLYVTGEMPEMVVTHRNGDGLDNRFSNLVTSDQHRKEKRSRLLTLARLKKLIYYDPTTGTFTRLIAKRRRGWVEVNRAITTTDAWGYIKIVVDDVQYKGHRLAWFYSYGVWPETHIDHINRVKNDNRMDNLRLATNAENAQNKGMSSKNTSGAKGVTWDASNSKWMAQIAVGGRNYKLGRYSDINDAIAARKEAEDKYHPFAPKDMKHA